MERTATERLFPTLTATQMARIAARGRRRKIAAGEVLIEAADKNVPFFLVVTGQVQAIARIHEAINEPVPIIGRCNYQALDVPMIRGSLLHDRGEIVRQPFVVDPLILLIE